MSRKRDAALLTPGRVALDAARHVHWPALEAAASGDLSYFIRNRRATPVSATHGKPIKLAARFTA